MKRALVLSLLLLSMMVIFTSCGGGGGGGGGGNENPGGGGDNTTSVSGKVTLSGTGSSKPSAKTTLIQKVLAAAGISMAPGQGLPGATVRMYDANHPEWLYPVAEVLTLSDGSYTLDELTYSTQNGGSYADGDAIPAGNYTILVEKHDTTTLPPKFYVKVQSVVRNFSGTVLNNDIEVMESSLTPPPSVVSMFGVEPKTDGTFGGPSTNVPVNAAIQIVFSMPMARASKDAITIQTGATTVGGVWKFSPDLLTATFYPDADLAQSSLYTITVGTGAWSVYDKPLPAAVTGQFTASALDDVPPNVIRYRPVNQLDVPVTTATQIKSTKILDINTMSVSGSPSIGYKPVVTYVGKSNDVSYPYVYDIGHTPLSLNTNYAVTISGAKDIANNVLQTYTFNFKTEQLSTGITGTAPGTINEQLAVKDVLGKWLNALETKKSALLTNFMTGDFYYLLASPSEYDQNRDGRLNQSEFTDKLTDQFDDLASCPSVTVTGNVIDEVADPTYGGIRITGSTATMEFTLSLPDSGCTLVPQTLYAEFQKINGVWTLAKVSETAPAAGYPAPLGVINLLSPEHGRLFDEPTEASPLLPAFQWTAVSNATTYAVVVTDTTATTLDTGWVSVISAASYTSGDTVSLTFNGTPGGDPYVLPQANLNPFGFQNAITKLKAGKTYNWAVLAFKSKVVSDFTTTAGVQDAPADVGASSTPNSFNVRNNFPPYVVSTNPDNLATGVSTTAPITAVFSEDMLVSTITNTTFTLSLSGSPVAAVVTYDPATLTATLTPSSPLQYNTTYIASISTDVKDLAGNPMATAKTWGFSTAGPPDTTPPVTTASPAGGTYNTSKSVTLTANEAATIYYTTDGSTPDCTPSGGSCTPTGTTLSGTSPVLGISISSSKTLKFFGRDTYVNTEGVKTEVYTIDTTPPTSWASPAGGTYGAAQTVTLTASEPATIWMTTNNSDPSNVSNPDRSQYNGSFTIISAGTTTVKFYAIDTAGNNETPYHTEAYTIDTTKPNTTASPAGGYYNAAQTVTLTATYSAPATSAAICYTRDGTTPTNPATGTTLCGSSPVSSISITTTTTLKFFAKDDQNRAEDVKTAVYTIDTAAPSTTPSPVGGLYNSAQTVTLTCSDTGGSGCSKIYYTTNGVDPTTSSAVYSGPITISTTTTLKYRAQDAAGNLEAVKSQTYTIDTVAPTVTTKTPASGATNVDVISKITVTFSEAMNIATITSSTFTVKLGTTSVSGTFAFSNGNMTATFTPSARTSPLAPLDFSSTYTVTLTNGIKDVAGNALSTTTWTFTTQYGKWDDTGTTYNRWDVATWGP